MDNLAVDTLHPDVLDAIRRALREDVGSGDVTTNSIIPAGAALRGQILAKQKGVIAGLDIAAAVYAEVEPNIEFNALVNEGSRVENLQQLARVSGPARA